MSNRADQFLGGKKRGSQTGTFPYTYRVVSFPQFLCTPLIYPYVPCFYLSPPCTAENSFEYLRPFLKPLSAVVLAMTDHNWGGFKWIGVRVEKTHPSEKEGCYRFVVSPIRTDTPLHFVYIPSRPPRAWPYLAVI